MRENKLTNVIEGILLIVLGVLIAVIGVNTTVNIYFGVVFTLIGAGAVILACVLAIRKAPLLFPTFALGGASIALGAGLFAGYISLAYIIPILIIVALGLGAALAAYGIYSAIRRNGFYGLGQIVVGAAIVALAACYINFPGFQTVFWIIVGVLIAVYGAFFLIASLLDNKKSK